MGEACSSYQKLPKSDETFIKRLSKKIIKDANSQASIANYTKPPLLCMILREGKRMTKEPMDYMDLKESNDYLYTCNKSVQACVGGQEQCVDGLMSEILAFGVRNHDVDQVLILTNLYAKMYDFVLSFGFRDEVLSRKKLEWKREGSTCEIGEKVGEMQDSLVSFHFWFSWCQEDCREEVT